ncbi:uncharacterized protein [Aristolochia californica]|uniref:uncharacterized protein n=1 Tax=Aristolochia californica TaxID=171875 RepID=UPI0035DB09E4
MELPCSRAFIVIFFLLSAMTISFLIALERTKLATQSYEYHSRGWLRETTKWDQQNRRFIVSLMEGGLGEIPVPKEHVAGTILEEKTLVVDPDIGSGNCSLGFVIDRPRNRLVVVVADLMRGTFGGLASYDMATWHRLFLTRLAGPGNEKSLADDVAVDADGNAYVTDAKASKIWKVGPNGNLIKVIKSHLFRPNKEWYYNFVGLNGIVYHPDGFLLTVHTFGGVLFKISNLGSKEEAVQKVELLNGFSLVLGDGIELLSSTQLIVSGTPSGRLVESNDGWATARVVGRYMGPMHRVATSATVKDGKAHLSHLFGGGFPTKKHVIVEAVFSPLK